MDALARLLNKASGHVYASLCAAVVAEVILFALGVNLQWYVQTGPTAAIQRMAKLTNGFFFPPARPPDLCKALAGTVCGSSRSAVSGRKGRVYILPGELERE